jgi:hypothetical protein
MYMSNSFPFIYTSDKSIDVYEQSKLFIEQSDYKTKIAELAWAYHSIGDVIPQTNESFWSGHFFPWMESWDEIQISFTLCSFGLYKQAMVSLRAGLELGLLSVYWNLNDDGHQVVKKWLGSKEYTPQFEDIWKKLIQHQNFKLFQQKYDLKNRIKTLQSSLHKYVHTRGVRFSNSMGLFKSNFQTFEEESFQTWFVAFQETIKILALTHLIKYPVGVIKHEYDRKFGIDRPMFGGLSESKIRLLEKIIGEEIFKVIVDISTQDPQVQAINTWLERLPDMTSDELEKQILKFDQFNIEMMGLEAWLQLEDKLLGNSSERSEQRLRRIEYLTQWAKEQGFEKARFERKK